MVFRVSDFGRVVGFAGFRLCSVAAVAFGFVAVSGCGESRPATYPVAGRVTVGGTPAAGAEVTLHPVEAEWSKDWPHRPFGKVGADGGLTFSTFAANDGAPAGKYVVTIGWVGEDRETDKLGGAHTNPNRSGAITTEVAPETTQLPPIDLPAPPRGR